MRLPPMVKYTLARVGIFVVVGVALVPLVHQMLLALLISAVLTSIFSLFFLKKWRNEVAATLEHSMTARRAEKEKLRAALAGDDEPAQVVEL